MVGFISDNPTGSAWVSGDRQPRRPLRRGNLESQFLAGNLRGAAQSRERRRARNQRYERVQDSYTNTARQNYMNRQSGGNAFGPSQTSRTAGQRINSAPASRTSSAPAPILPSSAPATSGPVMGPHPAPWGSTSDPVIQANPSAQNALHNILGELRAGLDSFTSEISTAPTNREPSQPTSSPQPPRAPKPRPAQPQQQHGSNGENSTSTTNWFAIIVVGFILLNIIGSIF